MKKLTQLLTLLFLVSSLHAQNFEWAVKWGGVSAEQYSSISVDAAGNMYCFMSFIDKIDADPGPDTLDISWGNGKLLLTKVDPNGNLIWAKQFGGPGADNSTGLTVDAAGNIFVTGYFEYTVDFDLGPGVSTLSSSGGWDVFAAKYDTDGNLVWARKFGGGDEDQGYVIASDASGNVYVSGSFEDTADFNPGAPTFNLIAHAINDVFIVKLSALGNFVWAKRLDGVSANSHYLHDLALDDQGNIYATGMFRGALDFNPDFGTFVMHSSSSNQDPLFGSYDAYVLKLNNNGSFIWAKQMGGSSGGCIGKNIAIDPAGDVCLMGTQYGNVDYDPGSAVFTLPDETHGMFLSKLSADGDFRWANGVVSTGNATSESMALDAEGNYYVTGSLNKGTFDFDPGPDTLNLVSTMNYDFFVAKYNPSGALVWAIKQANTEDYLGGNDITVDVFGGVYCSGFFFGELNLYTGPVDGVGLISSGAQDVFVYKLNQSSVAVKDAPALNPFKVYPNPGTGIFTLETEANAACTVRDLMGNVVYRGRGKASIDLSKCANGLYLVTVGNRTEKLLKQD